MYANTREDEIECPVWYTVALSPKCSFTMPVLMADLGDEKYILNIFKYFLKATENSLGQNWTPLTMG